MFIFRYIFFIAFLAAAVVSVSAQDRPAPQTDTLEIFTYDTVSVTNSAANQIQAADTVVKKKFISGAEIVVDYGKILLLWTNFESKYEAGFNLRFKERIVLATELGYEELNPLKAYDNALYYTVEGNYGRIGLDYYTAYNPKSFYYVGFRYAMSFFEDQGGFFIDSDYWEDYIEEFGSTGLTASWVELVLGTETYLNIGKKKEEGKVSKFLIGWKFRLRFLTDFENREEPTVYAIPGYGRTFNNVVPAVNLYIKYRIGH